MRSQKSAIIYQCLWPRRRGDYQRMKTYIVSVNPDTRRLIESHEKDEINFSPFEDCEVNVDCSIQRRGHHDIFNDLPVRIRHQLSLEDAQRFHHEIERYLRSSSVSCSFKIIHHQRQCEFSLRFGNDMAISYMTNDFPYEPRQIVFYGVDTSLKVILESYLYRQTRFAQAVLSCLSLLGAIRIDL